MNREVYSYATKKLFPNGEEIIKIANRIKRIDAIKKCTTFLDQDTGEIVEIKNIHTMESAIESARRAKQMLIDLAKCNEFTYFLTLTFSPNELNRLNDIETRCAFQVWRKSTRRKLPNMIYIGVPEYHKKGGLHFHLIVGGVDEQDLKLELTDKVCCSFVSKKACSKDYYEKNKDRYKLSETDGLEIYNVRAWKKGFSTATKVMNNEAVKNYIAKYIGKGCVDARFLNKKRFFTSENIERPYVEKIKSILLPWKPFIGNLVLSPGVIDQLNLRNGEYNIDYLDEDKQYIVFSRKGGAVLYEKAFKEFNLQNGFENIEEERYYPKTFKPKPIFAELPYKLVEVPDEDMSF